MVANPPRLDLAFHALANTTRRAVVERLQQGPATVSELARPFTMALPSFLEHLRILEASGLVKSRKAGRVRTVRVVPGRLQHAASWLEKQRVLWEKRLDQLDTYVRTMENEQ
jgi:DNA-binding transcriptional ArsR family regulator